MTDPERRSHVTSDRQAAMRVLALSGADALEAAYAKFNDLPEWRFLRRPETGLVMVRGRIGGGGAPFNLGEMSVTRSAVALETGETGHAYIAGRNQRKAAIAAVFDALWQAGAYRRRVESDVLAPLGQALMDSDDKAARQAAATKVDFFTLVRGED